MKGEERPLRKEREKNDDDDGDGFEAPIERTLVLCKTTLLDAKCFTPN